MLIEEMPKAWLTKRTGKLRLRVRHVLGSLIFGGWSSDAKKEWATFMSRLEAGDQLWRFRSPRETWDSRAGRAGVAIVRNSEVVAAYVTAMN